VSEPDQEAENFLRRWSQRKQAATTRARGAGDPPDAAKTETSGPPGDTTETPADQPAFDPKTLPPIESITATSDIRAFLAPGVPEELSRAALRRAWASDPAIRDFIGIAENQWDFTKPDSVPGFGSLEMTPELRQLVARLVGGVPDAPAPQLPSEQPSVQIVEASAGLPPPVTPPAAGDGAQQALPFERANKDTATQTDQDDESGEQSAWRKHGSAVPR
jgi:hypothetical protein